MSLIKEHLHREREDRKFYLSDDKIKRLLSYLDEDSDPAIMDIRDDLFHQYHF